MKSGKETFRIVDYINASGIWQKSARGIYEMTSWNLQFYFFVQFLDPYLYQATYVFWLNLYSQSHYEEASLGDCMLLLLLLLAGCHFSLLFVCMFVNRITWKAMDGVHKIWGIDRLWTRQVD